MARTDNPIVALRSGRRRPRTVLKRTAVARQSEIGVAPCHADGAQARKRLFVEQELRLAAGGGAESADDDLRP